MSRCSITLALDRFPILFVVVDIIKHMRISLGNLSFGTNVNVKLLLSLTNITEPLTVNIVPSG
jgi:hypothetical protein